MSVDDEKRLAAAAAAELVLDGMRVGLGTGSTVAWLLPELARRGAAALYVATSPRTEEAAKALGLHVEAFDRRDRLDLAIDGADQIADDGWLIKGGGGAHTREKIVAACAERFIVIADASKLVATLHPPVPVELLAYGLKATLRHLEPTTLRDVAASPDGGLIGDYHGAVDDPAGLSERLDATPGLIGHGLFSPELVGDVLVAVGTTIRQLTAGGLR
jgi:ribose 5-phosphate isomerase A